MNKTKTQFLGGRPQAAPALPGGHATAAAADEVVVAARGGGAAPLLLERVLLRVQLRHACVPLAPPLLVARRELRGTSEGLLPPRVPAEDTVGAVVCDVRVSREAVCLCAPRRTR